MALPQTPSTPKKMINNATLVPSTPISSPQFSILSTPRKSKQQFVFDLWLSIYQKCQHVMISNDVKFEELNHFMMDKTLIEVVGRFWNVITSYCKQESMNEDKKTMLKNSKIILSSLMIAKFPNDVLDCADLNQLNCLSEQCYNSATVVAEILFKENPKNFQDSNTSKLRCEEVVNSIQNYFNAFYSWQNDDKKRVVELVSNYYEQWTKSYNVINKCSMNEKQRSEILNSISINVQKTKQKILRLCGEQEGNMLCEHIDRKIENEVNIISDPKPNDSNSDTDINTNINANVNVNIDELKQDYDASHNNVNNNNADDSIEKKLKASGIPMSIKTGFNLRKDDYLNDNINKNNDNNNENDDTESKYVEIVNGMSMLNLDKIITDEGSKQYWLQFENQIKQQNWSLLFELLTELLTRIKKISNVKDHSMIDDLIDIKFIEQTIKLGFLDSKGFCAIFDGIWRQIKNLHSPSQDKAWDEWYFSICKQMRMVDATWHKLLPSIFNKFFVKLDEIEDSVALFRSLMKTNNETKQN